MKLQNRAARLTANNSFDAPGIPLVGRLNSKTIEELIVHEAELMVFKSLIATRDFKSYLNYYVPFLY